MEFNPCTARPLYIYIRFTLSLVLLDLYIMQFNPCAARPYVYSLTLVLLDPHVYSLNLVLLDPMYTV